MFVWQEDDVGTRQKQKQNKKTSSVALNSNWKVKIYHRESFNASIICSCFSLVSLESHWAGLQIKSIWHKLHSFWGQQYSQAHTSIKFLNWLLMAMVTIHPANSLSALLSSPGTNCQGCNERSLGCFILISWKKILLL